MHVEAKQRALDKQAKKPVTLGENITCENAVTIHLHTNCEPLI